MILAFFIATSLTNRKLVTMGYMNAIPASDSASTVFHQKRIGTKITCFLPRNIFVQMEINHLVDMTGLVCYMVHLKIGQRSEIFFVISTINVLTGIIVQKMVLKFSEDFMVFFYFLIF